MYTICNVHNLIHLNNEVKKAIKFFGSKNLIAFHLKIT